MPKNPLYGLMAVLLMLCSACMPLLRNEARQEEGVSLQESSQTALSQKEDDAEEQSRDSSPESGALELTGADIRELEGLLERFWNISGNELDVRHATALDIMNLIMVGFDAPGYIPYFGDLQPYRGEEPDPLQRFLREETFVDGTVTEYAYYYTFPADNVDWIVENIFHVQPDRTVDNEYLYAYDGSYYREAGDAGFMGHEVSVRDWQPLGDGRYMLICDYTVMGDSQPSHYMVADLQEIDGERTWTFYLLSSQYMDMSSGEPVYRLEKGTIWRQKGILRQGDNPFGTEYYLELERPVNVAVEGSAFTLETMGAAPYSWEEYKVELGEHVGKQVLLRGELVFGSSPQSKEILVSLESAYAY